MLQRATTAAPWAGTCWLAPSLVPPLCGRQQAGVAVSRCGTHAESLWLHWGASEIEPSLVVEDTACAADTRRAKLQACSQAALQGPAAVWHVAGMTQSAAAIPDPNASNVRNDGSAQPTCKPRQPVRVVDHLGCSRQGRPWCGQRIESATGDWLLRCTPGSFLPRCSTLGPCRRPMLSTC